MFRLSLSSILLLKCIPDVPGSTLSKTVLDLQENKVETKSNVVKQRCICYLFWWQFNGNSGVKKRTTFGYKGGSLKRNKKSLYLLVCRILFKGYFTVCDTSCNCKFRD